LKKKERKIRKKMELKEYIESAEIQRAWDMEDILRLIQGVVGVFGFCIFFWCLNYDNGNYRCL